MGYQYPAPPPTLAGDYVTVNRFLNSPALLSRRLYDITSQRFIADTLLTARAPVEGGAIIYEGDEGMYSDRAVEQVAPGSEYTLTTLTTGPASVARVVKWGQDSEVTDEAIRRQKLPAVDRALQKLANTLIKQVDSIALSLITSQITQTQAASQVWTGSAATMLRDIMLAKAQIAALNKGYDPNVLVVNDLAWAYLASDPVLISAMRRENAANAVYSGNFDTIAGLAVLPTPNMPGSGPLLVDTSALGGLASEDLGGGYAIANNGVEVKSIREDRRDLWRVRARRVVVPYVQNPLAAIRITGTGT